MLSENLNRLHYVAFTTESTPKRGKKGQQKKVTCVKRVKAKTGVTSHLISVSRVRNNQ